MRRTTFENVKIPISIFKRRRTRVNEWIQICMRNGRSYRDMTDDMTVTYT